VTARRGAGCFDVRGNTIAGPFGIRVRQASPATAQLEQSVSASSSAATVLDDNHAPGTVTSVLGTVTVVSNSTCQAAPAFALSPSPAGNEFTLQSEAATRSDSPGRRLGRREDALAAVLGRRPAAHDVIKLSDTELSGMAQAAIARWANAGISAEDLARLQTVTFEAADLPGDQLASARGNRVLIDETAAGYGWLFDPSPLEDSEFEVYVADNVNIGVLPAGKSITITFNATINDPFPAGVCQVSNQGTVSGSNFATVQTNTVTRTVETPPTIAAAAALSRQQGSAASVSQIATVNDCNQTENTLTVTVTPLTGSGVTIARRALTPRATSRPAWAHPARPPTRPSH